MGINHNRALAHLQAHRGRWVRPVTNAQLLSYLYLALKDIAIAARFGADDYIFRLADHVPDSQLVAIPVQVTSEATSLAVA